MPEVGFVESKHEIYMCLVDGTVGASLLISRRGLCLREINSKPRPISISVLRWQAMEKGGEFTY